MSGLILEGGAFRGMFTSGALDALLDEKIYFPYVIGASSGCSYGFSYASRQRGRNLQLAERYTADKRYVGLANYPRNHALMDMKWVFDEIPNQHLPVDWNTFYNTPERFVTICSDAVSLTPVYYEKHHHDASGKLVAASCALPFYFPPIYFKGRHLVDGGLANPIPLMHSEQEGNESNFCILTKPRSYRHHLKAEERALIAYYTPISSNATNHLRVRYQFFNYAFERCLREDGSSKNVSIFIDEPLMISRFARDLDKLRALYHSGYENVMRRLREIKDLVRAK